MRLIFTILFLYSFTANATNYFVSNLGSDANSGTSTSNPWQTIAKVNMSSFIPGDSLFFNKGGIWREMLVLTSSGTQGNPIFIGSYGSGNNPVLTGFQTLSSFTNIGNIWSSTLSNAPNALSVVLVNSKPAYKARYPNTGYLTFTSSDTISITGSLTGDYTGKEIVIRTTPWIVDKNTVASQVGGKLKFISKFPRAVSGGNGYFFQNDISFLDSLNEWTYDSTSKTLSIYQTISPTIQYSTIDTLVWVKGSWITINGINMTGANRVIVQVDSARGITIQNCSLNYSGSYGVFALKSNLLNIANDSIQNCYSGGIAGNLYINPPNQCDSAIITNNYIKNIAVYAGMGFYGSSQSYCGIFIHGLNKGPTIIGNTIDSIGYDGIYFLGKKSLIKNNYISNFCSVKNDGAGIYVTCNNTILTPSYNDSSYITSNIVVNAIGASAGISVITYSACIYLDDNTRLITVDSNTVSKGIGTSIMLNNNTSNALKANTVFDSSSNNVIITVSVEPYRIAHNIFCQLNPSLYTMKTPLGFSGTDSNYLYGANFVYNNIPYNLTAWRSTIGQDIHSSLPPTGITAVQPILKYNTKATTQTFLLGGTYFDYYGNNYNYSITLPPFKSAVLFKAIYNNRFNLMIRKITK